MSEATSAASTQALAAAVAAATAPGLGQAINAAVAQEPLTAPFPKLQPETSANEDQAAAVAAVSAAMTGVAAGQMTAATAAAISTAMAGAQLQNGTTATVGGDAVLASLNHSAHDQMLEIMTTYHSANAHRRRSSVEAAAAASSVLASIANSTKQPYMGSDMATAAAIAAAASPTSIAYSTGQSMQQQQTAAAAALLAASTMNPVMLPTIPSGTASLRNTPPPQASAGDHPDVSTSLAGFSAAAFSTLTSQGFAVPEAITAGAVTTAIDMPLSLTSMPAVDAMDKTPAKSSNRRRSKAKSKASRDSSDENEDVQVDEDGMPLTPDAPGSGRPGSLRNLTAEERRARRLQRNRLAAKECRQKKKAYIQNLEDQVSALQDENAQLRKEVEELNAKLTLGGMRNTSSAASTPVLESKRPTFENGDTSMESVSSPSLASKRPRIAVRSTSSTKLHNPDL
ncbi:hypothetical protein IWW36_005358 [Coemansia brasiliensis]|uniref:BZIP domain-containing protein n=1 Tax=Coemansia brasiliensis TaxID=2650707 RepID=A0A9W8LXX4_9FUNG|nr:hypothetical protein IWW36_005358 [Coemansia brasiliensis]